MHILPILLTAVLMVSLVAWLGYSRFMRTFFRKLRQALVPCEDQWTWTTQQGREYENVDVEDIEANALVIRHKLGRDRVPIVFLSKASRSKLVRDLNHAGKTNILAGPNFNAATDSADQQRPDKGFQAAA